MSTSNRGGALGFVFLLLVLGFGAALVLDLGGLGTRLLSLDRDAPLKLKEPLAVKPLPPPSRSSEPAAQVTPAWYLDASGYEGGELERQGARTGLVVYFKKQRCDDCRRFEREVLDAPEVKKFLQGVVKVRVDLESGLREQALARRFGVETAPAVVLVPQAGPPRLIPLHPAGPRTSLTPGQLIAYCR